MLSTGYHHLKPWQSNKTYNSVDKYENVLLQFVGYHIRLYHTGETELRLLYRIKTIINCYNRYTFTKCITVCACYVALLWDRASRDDDRGQCVATPYNSENLAVICGNVWLHVVMCGNVWQYVAMYGNAYNEWQYMTICGNIWQCMTMLMCGDVWQRHITGKTAPCSHRDRSNDALLAILCSLVSLKAIFFINASQKKDFFDCFRQNGKML